MSVHGPIPIFQIPIVKAKRVGLLCLALFLLCLPLSAKAQSDTTAKPSSGYYLPSEVRSQAKVHQNVMKEKKEHSPTRALVLSAILPGAGQVYNRQAWKIPIIYAALGGMAYYSYYNYTNMKQYKDEYLYRVQNDGAVSAFETLPTSNVYNLYQSYNQTFQLAIILSVAVYGLNLIDAYVYGHLFDFQIDDDLTLNFRPTATPLPTQQGLTLVPAATLTLRF